MALPEPFAAIAAGDSDRLARVLAGGADPAGRLPDWPGWTPLDAAIDALDEDGGPLEALVLLLRVGAPVEGAAGERDATPLQMAVLRGRHDAALILLAAGADPTRGAGGHGSPLFIAAEAGDLALAGTLLRNGAAPSLDRPGGMRGITPLGAAVERLDEAMVRLLLAAGAGPQAPDVDGRPPRALLPPQGQGAETSRAAILALLAPRG
jgi:ankyrin repeat protein